MTRSAAYLIEGITDAVSTCDCCGRTGLRRVVALRDAETGEVAMFGTTCAARALGMARSKGEMVALLAKAASRAEAVVRRVEGLMEAGVVPARVVETISRDSALLRATLTDGVPADIRYRAAEDREAFVIGYLGGKREVPATLGYFRRCVAARAARAA